MPADPTISGLVARLRSIEEKGDITVVVKIDVDLCKVTMRVSDMVKFTAQDAPRNLGMLLDALDGLLSKRPEGV